MTVLLLRSIFVYQRASLSKKPNRFLASSSGFLYKHTEAIKVAKLKGAPHIEPESSMITKLLYGRLTLFWINDSSFTLSTEFDIISEYKVAKFTAPVLTLASLVIFFSFSLSSSVARFCLIFSSSTLCSDCFCSLKDSHSSYHFFKSGYLGFSFSIENKSLFLTLSLARAGKEFNHSKKVCLSKELIFLVENNTDSSCWLYVFLHFL